MIEIYPGLYVGNQSDYESLVKHQPDWYVVHACKEPYHREALGYSGRAASNTHPEYLVARRGHRLILNLVDVADPAYIRREIIDAALDFIHEGLDAGKHVLVHCNQGESRAPSIGLLYLAVFTDKLPTGSLLEAETLFRSLYPAYNPARGMHEFLRVNWELYLGRERGEEAG